jgi:poly-gamma-glutamate capsule biosynthesis protein CapA/YwtB (metallophosphatase superfamily)
MKSDARTKVRADHGEVWRRVAILLVLGVTACTASQYLIAQDDPSEDTVPSLLSPSTAPTSQERHRDREKDLGLKITEPFTIAAVGDILEPDPVGDLADPRYQALVKIIRNADVGFANMESSVVDFHHREDFQGPLAGTLAPKEVAADIKSMGITMMNHANNHALDGEAPGMLATDAILDEYGIVHAGSGRNLQAARAASYLGTPKGRVGMVGMISLDTGVSDPDADNIGEYGASYIYMAATERIGEMGGRPGINPLRLTTLHVVSPDQMQTLQSFVQSYYGPSGPPAGLEGRQGSTDQLKLFDEWYKVGTPPGTLAFTMNSSDEQGNLESIRNGKVHSDFMIATIHAHNSAQDVNGVRTVSGFMVKFAHECIDNGADIFVTSGPHQLQGVEIYHGKPIFYGLGGFVFQTDLQLSYSSKGVLTAPGNEDLVSEDRSVFGVRRRSSGLLATSRYEGGRLVEVRLYPVDLGGYGRPSSDMGIPLTPSPEMANLILSEVQALSQPFGTKIDIENNVGVIHIAPAAGESGGK